MAIGDDKMYWETLPNWFWIIYYLSLIATLGTAIYCILRIKMIILSYIVIILTITVPIISLVNRIGRAEGHNEFEHLFIQLQQGYIWSFYALIGYVFILVWWSIFLFKKLKIQITN